MRQEELLEGLKKRVAAGEVVAIVGSGVSRQVTDNHPCASWVGLMKDGARRCDLGTLIPLIDSGSLNLMLAAGEALSAELGAPDGGEYAKWLHEAVGGLSILNGSLLDAIHGLGAMLATTNYDDLLTRDRKLTPVPWNDGRKVEEVVRGDRSGVIHLHGYFDEPRSVVLGIRSYEKVVDSKHAQIIQRALWTTKTFLFIGCGDGLSDPNLGALLKWAAEIFKGSPYRHFRLCREDELKELNARHPPAQRLFPLSYGTSFDDLTPFLQSLGARNRTGAAVSTSHERAESQTRPLIALINHNKPFKRSLPRELLTDLQWAKGFADDLRGKQPSTLLVIGPDLDRCDDLTGNVFDRLVDLAPEEWDAAAFQPDPGNPRTPVPLKFDLSEVLRTLVARLNVVTVLNHSRLAADAFPSWIEFPQEYYATRRAGGMACVNCVVTESNIRDPQRAPGYRPFMEWHAKVIRNPDFERVIVFGFDIPQYAMRIADWLQGDRGIAPIMFLTRSTRAVRDPRTGEDPFRGLNLRLFDRFEDHVSGILALAQIDWALQREPDSSASLVGRPSDLTRHLLVRYENVMNRSCGGGSYNVVQQQIPVVAAGEEPFETVLSAMASKRSMERALLIAPAGAGKTTQTLFVAAEVCRIILRIATVSEKHRLASGDPRWPLVSKVPVFITAQEIGSIIADHMSSAQPERNPLQPDSYYLHIARVLALSETHTRELLELLMDGDVLFLIDSIDELDAVVHHSALTFVHSLLDQYSQCPAVITSRVGEVVRTEWPGFVPLTLESLNDQLIALYVRERQRLAPTCQALSTLLDLVMRKDQDQMVVLRQPMVLRLFCDALQALPPEVPFEQLPGDRAGIYRRIMETIVDGNIRSAGIGEGSPLGRSEVHLYALASLARTLLVENLIGAGQKHRYENVAGGLHREMTRTLKAALQDSAAPYGAVGDDELTRVVATYLPRLASATPDQGVLLFEYLYGDRVRFAHRSFQEFLAALSFYFDIKKDPPSDAERVPALMMELDELGDDREVSRFFAGLMLRGASDWERRHSQAIIQHRLPSITPGQPEDRQQDSTWVLRLLGDVGYGSGDSPRIVQHFFGHKMQREMKGIISEIGNARKSEIPELLDVFFRAQPRNSYLLFHAVERLEALRESASTVQPDVRPRTTQYVKRAERILDDLWRESSRFGPPIPASGLEGFAAQWNGNQCVPAPNMIRIPQGDVILSNGRSVTVPAFYAGETLVTKAQFAVMTGKNMTESGDLRMPYTNATWYDAMMFARWAFGGLGTLPTRTQWIRMARGRSLDEFPWGTESDGATVNTLANTAQFDCPGPTPVDHFGPQGEFKLYDLGGNLLEWTDTWFDPDELSDGGEFEPEPEHGYARLLMGGSYAHIIEKAKCTFPFPSSPENYVDLIGARIAVAEEDYIRWKDSASHS